MIKKYYSYVDGLRGFAVLSVVIYHLFPDILKGGFIGVDIFFVISGFLITKNIVHNLNDNNFDFYDFFGRRVRRIFPALLLILICSLLFGFFILFNQEFIYLNKHVASGSGFIINFILNNEGGYFDIDSERKPMLHLWSLAVEEQFYIIWPFVIWFAWKRNLSLLTITLILMSISFYYNFKYYEINSSKNFFLTISRFWEILSGSILAYLFIYKKDQLLKLAKFINNFFINLINIKDNFNIVFFISNLLSLIGISLLIYGVIKINENLSFPSYWAFFPVLGTSLIILSGQKSLINRIILMNKISVWFGLISYPLYLWHWPILSLTYIALGETLNIKLKILCLIISIILSWLTYVLIEKNVRNNKNTKIKTFILCFFMIIIFLLSLFIYKTNLKIIPSTPKQIVSDSAIYSPMRKKCHFSKNIESIGKEACNYFGKKVKVAVFGNSHGVELAYALAEELRNSDIGIIHHTISGCAHNYGLRKKIPEIYNDHPKKLVRIEKALICADWHDSVMNSILSNTDLDTVIVSYRNEWHINQDLYSSALAQMLNDLGKFKKNVILVLQAPYIKQKDHAGKKLLINDYIRKYVFLPNSNISYFQLKNWQKTYKYKKKLAPKLQKNIKIYDPANKFCDDAKCYIIREGMALYADSDHISVNGARLIAKDIINLIN